jgi:hypothetical protein
MEQLQEARNRAYREFYLRPSYIFKRLRKIKSLKDLVTNYRQAKDFISSWISRSSTEKTPISKVSQVPVAPTSVTH